MKKISILSLFPDLIQNALSYGILKRTSDHLEIQNHDIRKWGVGNFKRVDDPVVASGPGMLLKPDVLASALQELDPERKAHVIHVSPRGIRFTADKAKELSQKHNLIIIASRYEGLDQRFIDHYVDEEISIGDYVLSGGELPSLVILDSILRMDHDILESDALEEESFEQGLLEYPHYTKPLEFEGEMIPEFLRSGNHEKIRQERFVQRLFITWLRRPDMLRDYPLCTVDVASQNPLTKIKKTNYLLKKRLQAFENVIQEYKRCLKKM
ncbi:MAG: tRNA (guanosine(37)-N1)-methyltransferase TrmD [Brevinema sp.]